ncbi:unnamed protein product [Cyclocybe aegerita]|uniref:EVE domain-containing protein n=1 Tax=Cyclocybe aegerita TaxID=1973307 RepID=A0A8S0X978_CYCAE|nr:unnamed protein product [Cyclocybe aegerita]
MSTSKSKYWLLKAEPDSRIVKGKDVKFSVDDFEKVKTSPWEGVRNYEARNLMKEMKEGEQALFYHSNCKSPGIAAFAKVSKEAYPDYTAWDLSHPYFDPKSNQDDPKWFMVDLTFSARAANFVPLALLRLLADQPFSQPPKELSYLGEKGVQAIKTMDLVTRGRLSVQRVGEDAWEAIQFLAEKGGWDELDMNPKKKPPAKRKAKEKDSEDGSKAKREKKETKRKRKIEEEDGDEHDEAEFSNLSDEEKPSTSKQRREEKSKESTISFGTHAPEITRIIDVACGANHTILLLEVKQADETCREIWGCGDGRKGQLGSKYRQDGSKTSFTRLVLKLEAAGLGGYVFKLIAATWETTYITLEHEEKGDVVISLGSDDYGDLGVGGLRSAKREGKEMVHPQDFHIIRFDHLSASGARFDNMKVEAISSGQRHVVIQLRLPQPNSKSSRSHIFVGWGSSRHGQLGSSLKPVQPLPQLVHSPDADGIESYSAGLHHTIFLSNVGRLSALGSDRKNQLQVVDHFSSVPSRVQFVGCTWNGTYAIVQDDLGVSSVYSSGSNSHSQLGWMPTTNLDKRIGKVVFPYDSDTQKTVVQLACGSEHVLVLILQGHDCSSARQEVWGWGWNEHGNLGTGDTKDVPTPIKVWPPNTDDGLMKVEGIWAGCGSSWIAYRDAL